MFGEKGYVKYECERIKASAVDESLITELNSYRSKLYHHGLIGVYPNGIGYGNMSVRLEENSFLITGTSTGHLEKLTNDHFTKVVDYNFKENRLTCQGPIKASAESLTHASVYESSPETMAVIHIHSQLLWDQLKNNVPTTAPEIEYGTPEMALEISRLFRETDVKARQILVMAGHEEGIISFGKTLDEAFNLIINHIK